MAETFDTLESKIEWAKLRQSGIVATMAHLNEVMANSLKDIEDQDRRLTYSMPSPYDHAAAKREIERLDWVIGLLEKEGSS